MDMSWENMPISSKHHRNPSFSSSLLDQIYRSIDDSPPKKNQHNHRNVSLQEDRKISPLVFHRRSVATDFDRSTRRSKTSGNTSVFLRYSNSTSSDSSGFSSSESKSSASPPSTTRQPKPIRTSLDNSSCVQKPNSKQDLGGFLRTKSKALKIYTDLKKVKQPISPGGRLATFLNSLFTNTNTNTKKPKKSEPQSSTTTTTCSSASSFSRSCLSKTPSSSGKSKRSVRFCPVNVILDEEYSSSVHMPYAYSNNNHRHVMEEENRRVIEAAKDLLRTFQKNKDHLPVTKCEEEEEDDYDDAASCASSDLFELENLSAIGIERYREELPVYETTRLDNTNRAIATSLIV